MNLDRLNPKYSPDRLALVEVHAGVGNDTVGQRERLVLPLPSIRDGLGSRSERSLRLRDIQTDTRERLIAYANSGLIKLGDSSGIP